MIKINLLPQKRAKRSIHVGSDDGSREFLIGMGALAGVAFAVFLVFDQPKRSRINELAASNEQLQGDIQAKNKQLVGYAELQKAADEAVERANSINRLNAARIVPANMLNELGEILTANHLPTMTEEMARKTGTGTDSDPNKRFDFAWDPTHVWLTSIADQKDGTFKDAGFPWGVAVSEDGAEQGSMGVALEIVFLVRVLHVPPAVTGLIVALAALGGVAGGASSQWLARRIGSARIIWVSTLAFGPVGLLIPLSRPGWGVLFFVLGWFGFSFTGVVYNVAQLSYRQAVCPPQLLGRMNSAVRWIVWGTLPLGGLLGGILGSAFGIRATLFAAAAGAWAAGLWVFFSPLRGMRDVPPPGTYVAGTPAGGPAQRPAPAVET